jgi:hypothetical protein
MLSDKLVSIIRTLNRQDHQNCRDFIVSPYFNKASDVVQLYDYILQLLRKSTKTNDDAWQKEYVWKQIYPKKTYNDVLMRRLTSELTRLIHGYLTQQHLSPEQQALTLLPVVARHGLEKHFNGLIRQVRSELTEKGEEDSAFHLNLYRLELTQHRYQEQSDWRSNNLESLLAAARHLETYYHAQQLYLYCEALSHYIFRKKTPELPRPTILSPEYDDAHGILDAPPVKAFMLAARMLQNDEQAYRDLRAYMSEYDKKFSPEVLKTIFLYLKNYCIHLKINNGDSSYFRDIFDLYRYSLEAGLLIEFGALNPQHYKNINTIGLRIGEYAWTEQFILDYTHLLPEGNLDNAQSYNLAKLFFHQRDYRKVIEQLRAVEYQDITYALGARLMLLKTYFELQEHKALDSLLESFGVYLRRNQHISRDVQQQYLNVLRFTRKITNLPPGDKTAIIKLKTQLQECKAIAARDWLEEKIDAIENRK